MQFKRTTIRIRLASGQGLGLFFGSDGLPFIPDFNADLMFTAPFPALSKRSIPRDSVDGALNSFGLSQRKLNGWLGQKAFLPTQEYVVGCRQREKWVLMMFSSLFGKDSLQSYGPQTRMDNVLWILSKAIYPKSYRSFQ